MIHKVYGNIVQISPSNRTFCLNVAMKCVANVYVPENDESIGLNTGVVCVT